jgi:RNA polymerase sigma-70 factor (ECF subfamily)
MASFELELAPLGTASAPDRSEPPALRIGRLYEQHFRMIRALCQLLLRDPVDAEDAAQQTFLSAFGSLIDGTVPQLPAPWLATIARRECWARTAQRRRQPLALDETNAPASAANNPLDEAIRNVDLNALWRAINDLPRQQRSAFLMREFAGLSYAEVAEALGATESAIESLLVRARRQLRDGLEPAIRTANLLATPLVLLQHRLGRLFGERRGATGAAATAAIPAAAKLGAVLAGAVVVGSAGVGVGIRAGVFHDRTTTRTARLDLSTQTLAPDTPTAWNALVLLVGRPAADKLFPFTSSWDSLGSPATDATTTTPDSGLVTAGDINPANPADPTTTDSAPAPSEGTPTSATSTDPAPAAAPADPTASSGSSPSGQSTGPTDTTTTPADTTPNIDTTPTIDPTPADTTPAPTDPSAIEPTDTTAP